MTEQRQPFGARGHVVVIGVGAIGASVAHHALREGWSVTMLDTGSPGGPQAASYGNGAWMSPASILPMAMPGLWRKVPGMLLDPSGPLTVRLRSLPGLLPWLVRFLASGWTDAQVARTAAALNALLRDAPDRHVALATEIGLPSLIIRSGLLYAYANAAQFEAEHKAWGLRRQNGVAFETVEGEALRRLAPALADRYGFGVYVPGGAHCANPGHYVGAMVEAAVAKGATLLQGTATGFALNGSRLVSVMTEQGPLAADKAVLAAGMGSALLARRLGHPVPLAAERGYHVAISPPRIALPVPILPADGKMANTIVAGALRAAGQVEIAAPDAPPDWRRAEILLRHLQSAYPALPAAIPGDQVSRWMGCRPSTPDGLPAIGAARVSADVIYAFGHGHVGLAMAPMTGAIVAGALAGRPTPAAVRPERFPA